MVTISNPEKYVVGILVRLSNEKREDLIRYGESGSISNQKDLLNKFCEENHLKVYKTYVDDGESGAFYDRPAFVEMIKDIDAGYVNMVIVKDLSRFGRVASGIDDYIEEYFQLKGVRFVSVNENLDSKTSANFHDDIKIRAFFNEWFLRDCSKKTRDGKHNKALRGKVMSTYPKYGYKKDPNDRNHYIPNEETALIVQKIFNMLRDEMLPTDVAQWLNENNIPVPSDSVGNVHTRTRNEIKRKWNRTTVVRIARDETYLGYVINGMTRKVSYKSKKNISVPKEEQIKVAGMHEPLVDKETFDIVQRLIDSRKNTRKYKYDFLLKGLLECAECGKKLSILTMKQKNGNTIQYLRCNTYASMTRLKLCTPHSNNCEKLTNEVINTIRERLKKYIESEKYFELANDVKNKTTYKKNIIQNQIMAIKNKIIQINKKIDNLYEDKLNGILNVNDFQRMYITTLNQKEQLESSIKELEKESEETSHEVDLKKLVTDFMKMENVTREMIVSLVDKITVSEDKKIKIYYKFSILNESSNKNNIINIKTA